MREWPKTATYGTMHLLVAMTVAFAFSGSWRVALGIGIVEPLVQTLFYILHERLWGRANSRPVPARPPRPARSTARKPRSAAPIGPCLTCP